MQAPGGARSAEIAAGLAPSNELGCALGAIACSTTAVGIALSMHPALPLWLIGQCVLAVALLQWFVVLHEAGHGTLFRARLLNRLVGHLGGFFAVIPYASWRRVHGLHHVWTGWQDLDPTTAGLAPRSRSRIECALVDWAWRTGLPLFSIVYRLSNYWNVARFAAIFSGRRQRAALALNVAILVAIYGLLAWHLGFADLVRIGALALFISLVLQDPLILSQHSHIPQRLSLGRAVAPLPPAAQVQYTRSLRFPGSVSRWILFGFDAHELHHRFPAVPGFRLRQIAHAPGNEIHWWSWLRAAKRQRGSVLLFENSDVTGFRG